MRIVMGVVLAVFGATAHPARANHEEAPQAYEIAAATAVTLLPTPLRAFFEAHLDGLQQVATAGLTDAPTAGKLPGRPDWHYVMLDVAAGDGDPKKSRAAVKAFPRDHAEARALFQQHRRSKGGQLPWIIDDQTKALVSAFQQGRSSAIVEAAGVVLHFATDAASPFNTTVDRDGTTDGHLHWAAGDDAAQPDQDHRSVRLRCQVELVKKLRKRLAFEVRVSPERYAAVTNRIELVFGVLIDAHDRLLQLRRIDRETTDALGLVDAATFAAGKDEYYAAMTDAGAATIENSLEAAGLLTAMLIGNAWNEAGRPLLPSVRPKATVKGVKDLTGVNGPLVGSRNSKIIHRPTCSHAKRIKAENRVTFDTPDDAFEVGRIPCKSCRPGGS